MITVSYSNNINIIIYYDGRQLYVFIAKVRFDRLTGTQISVSAQFRRILNVLDAYFIIYSAKSKQLYKILLYKVVVHAENFDETGTINGGGTGINV